MPVTSVVGGRLARQLAILATGVAAALLLAGLIDAAFAQAGQALPWKMHGRDLTPMLADPEATWSQPLLYEHTGHHYGSDVAKVLREEPEHAVHNNVPWYVVLRQGKYKYIRYLKAGEIEELYDLGADPEELTNLAGRPEMAKHLADLRQALVAELRRTEASFADALPPAGAVK